MPFHANPSPAQLDVWAANIGPDRAARGWICRTLEEAGWPYQTLASGGQCEDYLIAGWHGPVCPPVTPAFDVVHNDGRQLIVRATEPPPEAEQVRLFITHGHGSPKPEMVLRVVTLPGDVWLERFDLESLSWVEDNDTVNAYVMKGELPARESTPDEVRAALRTLLGKYDAMGGGA
jgi:hypothetical protein